MEKRDINEIVAQKIVDRREILREIVHDYPGIKKMVEFNGFEPKSPILKSLYSEKRNNSQPY